MATTTPEAGHVTAERGAARAALAIPFLAAGFRPFFLLAALWAAAAILLWLPVYSGSITLPAQISPLDWHIHEMLFGYAAGVIAGFLLTAIANWTGRPPVSGATLAGLVLLWAAGRVVMLLPLVPPLAAAVIDSAFLVALVAVGAREIIASRNWRNLRVLAVIGVLIAGNITFHAGLLRGFSTEIGARLSIAALILLISLIGGRIIPAFTGNWLMRNNPGKMPAPFSRFDAATLAVSALALANWIAAPDTHVTGALLLAAGVLHIIRVSRWAGTRTTRERLLLVLHVGYLFVPAGFLLLGASIWLAGIHAIPDSAGLHAWTAGAIGMMTLAVMARASLGHLGYPLTASAGTQAIYLVVFVAALLRIVAACTGDHTLLLIAGLGWAGAFLGFAASYGPALVGWLSAKRSA
ncbi:MAG: NnrS family protein [Pseudolabrys sp.]